MSDVAEEAKKLASKKLFIDTYVDFDLGRQTWFFTFNPNMVGATKKPTKFPGLEKDFPAWWKSIKNTQKKVLEKLEPFFPITSKYGRVKKALESWPADYYATDFTVKGSSCNLFVGEALFLAGKKAMNGNKYYSAKDIYDSKGPFKNVDKKEVKAGDIVAFGGTHVEVVTKVDGNSFCAIGAGHGSGLLFGIDSNGKEICGRELIGVNRYIDADTIKFKRV